MSKDDDDWREKDIETDDDINGDANLDCTYDLETDKKGTTKKI